MTPPIVLCYLEQEIPPLEASAPTFLRPTVDWPYNCDKLLVWCVRLLNQRSPSSCHLILSSCSLFVGRPHTSLVLCFGPLLKHSCNVRSARSVSFSGSFWIRRYGPPHFLLVAHSPPVICGISSGLLVPIMVGWMSRGYPVLVEKTAFHGWRWTALLPLAEPKTGEWNALIYSGLNYWKSD